MFEKAYRLSVLALALDLTLTLTSLATQNAVPASYAGVLAGTPGAVFHVEAVIVQLGVKAYYSTFGSWPETWQQVRDLGLVTADLHTPWGEPIDPDDRQLDSDYDFHYDFHAGSPRIALFNSAASPTISYQLFQTPPPLISDSALKDPQT